MASPHLKDIYPDYACSDMEYVKHWKVCYEGIFCVALEGKQYNKSNVYVIMCDDINSQQNLIDIMEQNIRKWYGEPNV